MAQKTQTIEDAIKPAEEKLAMFQSIFTQNKWLGQTADANRFVNDAVVIPPALLERLASRERLMALAKVVDSTAELESDAAELLDEILGAWVDDVTTNAAEIALLRKKPSNHAPVLHADDIHAAVRDAYPHLVLPTDRLSTQIPPVAPAMEIVRQQRIKAEKEAAARAASAQLGAGSAAVGVDVPRQVALGGSNTNAATGPAGGVDEVSRRKAAGEKAAATADLVDPETGEKISRPRGRPTKEFLRQHAYAISFAQRRYEAKKAGQPVPEYPFVLRQRAAGGR